jgi:23S rRNA (guanosine2251-2'-O)-methyltransferase
MNKKKGYEKEFKSPGKKQADTNVEKEADVFESEDYIYGKNPVIEYIRAGNIINRIMLMEGINPSTYAQIMNEAKKKDIDVRIVKAKVLDDLAPQSVHQGVIAYVSPVSYCEPEDILKKAEELNEKPFLLILDGLTDSRNIGAVIRSAEAAGVHGIIMPKRRSAAVNAAAAKASAGAAARMLISRVPNIPSLIDRLKEKGIWVIGTDINGTMPYWKCDFKDATALVIGSEDKGMSRLVLEKCDFLAKIPMKGTMNSLNVSVAAGIFLFEALRQRENI